MSDAILQQVIQAQQASGAFPSYVVLNGRAVPDENCCITALVGLSLLELPATRVLTQVLDRALAFVEACEDPQHPGAFRYYPYRIESPRLNIPIFNDLDDSALAALFLLKTGKRSREAICGHLDSVFENNRKLWVSDADPGWISAGAALTWLTGTAHKNPVDACVNANVAALYAQMGLWEAPMYLSCINSLQRLATYWGDPAQRWRYVAPFYAHPLELVYALERAVAAGATALQQPLNSFAKYSWSQVDTAQTWLMERPICCNDSGSPLWYAPVLQQVRRAFFQNAKMKLSNGNC
ncbi:hypothetical protein [Haliscomenobacter hydrossis]|uniref:Uncharacterized protein n=1 Tax=Haliscomenobacter hydrossis (strain ATCC 27775 / DSM 1100 / LMG 10767 / O) TaxID=760192 RepID=F4KYF4_HALH1|nr:hypothetical protein [Haliscomenobacter hydrossis]AEE49395.1 hypothetical protein Halhy_1502 [Haliscomenobacter hydrossis DSM 1100]